jgi:hypothetical protein
MNGDDIINTNDTMPVFPIGMRLYRRILCVLGYHVWETRQTAPGHCFGVQTAEGERKGKFGLHDESPLPLRDQCGHCFTLR